MTISFDPEFARTWLNSPDPDTREFGYTVAEALGVSDEDLFGYRLDFANYMQTLDRLVAEASSAGIFGALVSLWLTYDDGYDGGLITVDLPGGLRVASTHLAPKHLTRDQDAMGIDAAVAALQAVADEAAILIRAVES